MIKEPLSVLGNQFYSGSEITYEEERTMHTTEIYKIYHI